MLFLEYITQHHNNVKEHQLTDHNTCTVNLTNTQHKKAIRTLPSRSFCWCISSHMTQNTFPHILDASLWPNGRCHAIHHLFTKTNSGFLLCSIMLLSLANIICNTHYVNI